MNKKELIERVSEETKLSTANVNTVLCSVINTIAETMIRGKEVHIRNFATFTTKERKAKSGWDFLNEKEIPIPAKRVPFVRFSKDFKNCIDSEK